MSKIEQPSHYQGRGGMSANDVIRAFNLNFALGNVIKYVTRAGRKPDEPALDDLSKSLWYLLDEIQQELPAGQVEAFEELRAGLTSLLSVSKQPPRDLKGLAARGSTGGWGRVAVPRADFIKSMNGCVDDD